MRIKKKKMMMVMRMMMMMRKKKMTRKKMMKMVVMIMKIISFPFGVIGGVLLNGWVPMETNSQPSSDGASQTHLITSPNKHMTTYLRVGFLDKSN